MDLDECMRKHSIVGDQSDAENEKESGKKLRQDLFRETAKHFFVPQSSNTKLDIKICQSLYLDKFILKISSFLTGQSRVLKLSKF